MNRHRLILGSLGVIALCAFVGLRALIPAQAQTSPRNGQVTPTPVTQPNTVPQSGKSSTTETPEAGIKRITEEYAKAFNARNAKAAALLWTEDGEYIGVDGEIIRGRPAIEKSLTDEFKAHPKASIDVKVESVRVIGRQTALVEGTVTFKTPSQSTAEETHYSALQVLEEGQWRAASVREWLPNPDIGAVMKYLDWLVGEWTAQGSAGKISITYAWDENQTYLIGKYSITKDEKKVSSGTQVFARNPTGGMRSWMFDSTGTFNSAVWEREGKRWVEQTNGMLPDGTEINAVNVLIPLGKDAFSWQTTEHSADGVPLPSPAPIKVTRVKPSK